VVDTGTAGFDLPEEGPKTRLHQIEIEAWSVNRWTQKFVSGPRSALVAPPAPRVPDISFELFGYLVYRGIALASGVGPMLMDPINKGSQQARVNSQAKGWHCKA
jgi:hypothetical protein